MRLEIVDAKNMVRVGEPFTFVCRVTNTSERVMDLRVKLEASMDVDCDYTGSSDFLLGSLDPAAYREFPLTVCPSKLGLIKISPLILTNTLQMSQYTIEKLVDVFVVDTDYRDDETFQVNKFVRYDHAIQRPTEDSSLQLQVVWTKA